MNKNIDDIIKEITLSILQFDNDIKVGDPDGINKFLKIIPTYETFFSLRVPDKYEEKILFLKFKKEILDLFTALFVEDGIYKVAESLFIKNGDIKMQGDIPVQYPPTALTEEIDRISMKLDISVCKYDGPITDIKGFRWEKNPLYNLSDEEYRERLGTQVAGFKAFKENPFKEFVSKYQGLYDNEKTGSKSIIDTNHISLIYTKYQAYFTEDLDTWIDRFIFPNGNHIDPIDIDKKALSGSNRLVLLAILAAIQPYTGAGFDYNDFVLDRFGIKGYEKAKSIHKYKPEFENIFNECNAILKI